MLVNFNAHPRAGAYSFNHERVHLQTHQTLPTHISPTAFLPAMVVPGASFRQHDGPIRATFVLPCSIIERAAIFPRTLSKMPCSHLRTQHRTRRRGTPKDTIIIVLSAFCPTIPPNTLAHKAQRASYTHGTLTHGNQKAVLPST